MRNGFKMHHSRPILSLDQLCIYCKLATAQLRPKHATRTLSTSSRRNGQSASSQATDPGLTSLLKQDASVSTPSLPPNDGSSTARNTQRDTISPAARNSAVDSDRYYARRNTTQAFTQKPLLRRIGAFQKTCHICDSAEHLSRDCPQRVASQRPVYPADRSGFRSLSNLDSITMNGQSAENGKARQGFGITQSRTVNERWDGTSEINGARPQNVKRFSPASNRSIFSQNNPWNAIDTDTAIRKLKKSISTSSERQRPGIDNFPALIQRAEGKVKSQSPNVFTHRVMTPDSPSQQPQMFTGWSNKATSTTRIFEDKSTKEEQLEERRPVRTKSDRLMERIDGSRGRRSKNNDKTKLRDRNYRPRSRDEADKEDKDWTNHEEKVRRKVSQKAERERQLKEEADRLGPAHLRLKLPPFISITNLATLLGVRQSNLINRVRSQQMIQDVQYDMIISAEDAGIIAMEYGFYPTADKSAVDLFAAPAPKNVSNIPSRPPVVTIMVHVDHGKTTILDFLRNSSIAASEHGGITQHIGAFVVPLSSGKTITFLDTPGHAAFLSMRQRGANVTDIVILVVAADDSVMPQTIEAIKHAKAAKVPIIVAVNKIDKPEANIERVKQDLAHHEVEIEDYGGETQVVAVSGKTGQGMKELEESIITLSEILDHRAQKVGNAEGWIIEASTKNYGRVATVLVRCGTLCPGDVIVAGRAWGKVKTLRNEYGENVNAAEPGTPVEVDGWRIPPVPGDEVLQAEDEQHATAVTKTRDNLADQLQIVRDIDAINAVRREHHALAENEVKPDVAVRRFKQADPNHNNRVIQGNFIDRQKTNGTTEVHLIIKADVIGSAEAVVNLISALGNNEVRPNVLRASAGPLTESDVDLAASAGGYVLAFNTEVDSRVASLADQLGVEILQESIIYRIADAVNAKLEALLPPKIVQRVTGEAEIAAIFDYKVKGGKMMIAGCRVRNGVINKGSKVRVLRNNAQVFDG
jgi:translation initiation factor IF-2